MSDASVKRLRRNWHQQAREERAAFRADLEAVYPDVPECVRDDLWEWAWAEGHSAGVHEVETYYRDVALMLEKVARGLGK